MRLFHKIMAGVLALQLCATAASSIVDRRGALRIQGTQLVDKDGKQIQLTGMSLFWSTFGDGSPFYDTATVNWLVKDWQISLIRIAMGVTGAGGYTTKPVTNAARQSAMVDRVVQAAIANGIYVLIDWHEEQAPRHIDSAVSFFSRMAQKYANVPNVMFEIYNEPNADSAGNRYAWADIKPYGQTVISAIRKVSKNLVVMGVPQWDQRLADAYQDPLDTALYPNVAYTFHFYACTHNVSMLGTYPTRLPIFITEWGTVTSDGGSDGNVCTTSLPSVSYRGSTTDNWFANEIDKYKLSTANWSVSNKDEAASILLPTTDAISGWDTTTDLSASGKYVRSMIRRHCAQDSTVCPVLASGNSSVGIRNAARAIVMTRTSDRVRLDFPADADVRSVDLVSLDGKVLERAYPSTNSVSMGLPKASQPLWVRVRGGAGAVLRVPPAR